MISSYRGQGVGKALIEESIRVMKQHQIEVATLEAFETNNPAIALYKKMGYQVRDALYFFQLDNPKEAVLRSHDSYTIERCMSRKVQFLPFYPKWVPWQNKITHLPGSEALILYQEDQPVAYLVFWESVNKKGETTKIQIFQCETASNLAERKEVLHSFLSFLIQNAKHDPTISTFNLLADEEVKQILQKMGFQKTPGQVWMERLMI